MYTKELTFLKSSAEYNIEHDPACPMQYCSTILFYFIFQISCFDAYQDLLCLAEDGKLHYFDITSGRKLTCIEFNSEDPIKVVSLHQKNLAIGCRSGTISVIKSGSENILTLDTLTPSIITSICWASPTDIFVATNYGTVSKFELQQV